MKLKKIYKDKINQEFDFVISKMESCNNPDEMLYYFSGIQSLLNRIMNIEYSDDILFSYFVLERSHKDITNVLGSLKQGNPIMTFHEKFGGKLIGLTKELRDGFFDTKMRVEILKNIVVLTYTCTGNGYFLTEKGKIDIFSDTKKINK